VVRKRPLSLAAFSLADIGRDGDRRAAELGGQAKPFVTRESLSGLIDVDDEIHGVAPHLQIAKKKLAYPARCGNHADQIRTTG
jgi:hypothetical protein